MFIVESFTPTPSQDLVDQKWKKLGNPVIFLKWSYSIVYRTCDPHNETLFHSTLLLNNMPKGKMF